MRKLVVIAVAIFLVALVVACSGAPKQSSPQQGGTTAKSEAKIQLKAATMTPMEHMYSQGAKRFADLIKERTNGRIQISVYPDGQLGKGERELLEALQQGIIDIYVGSTGPIGGFSPSMLLVDIPFLFRDYQHVDKVLDGPIGKQLLDDLEKANLKGLAFWENGFRNLTNSKRPVKTPEDAKGLKIRTMENPVHLTAWKTLGVNPVPMPWAEVYGALQQRVVDGQENPVPVILNSKLYEVQKYLTMTQHVYSPAPIIMSLKKWQTLSKEDQDLFIKTAQEVAPWQRNLGRQNEQKMLSELEAKGMQIERNVDKSLWQKAMQPAFEEFAKQFGKDKIESIMNVK
ncbi:tripartite ATP-independent transporter solute receptor, DctP family [Thermanaeromonas toyohensis ToBE]|uniref:Tripartite ATP-independent transporter solute receptor, DctP family n=1 Tax=Thermanaeromonas toyohensis ToBE TaxID=698762 RepID=A0A1W1VYN8_9FIRM|nr:TRAP transporter substrate-binding protein [Thermanaeromonas toyohensis]SMB98468.1 tripartite ATP-independent transporter solute receptor, DctP family [Thermanaeromonas toyohensis ToBE]